MYNLTKFNNQLNSVSFRKFNARELDLFFSICSSLKEQGTEIVRFNFDHLKFTVDYKFTGQERFIKDLENTYNKMLDLKFRYEDEDKIVKFVLFNKFEINKKDAYVEIAVNKEFDFILNELTGNFTAFELEQFTGLTSIYSKTMFRLLKSWKSVGKVSYDLDEFRNLLDIPNSYKMTNIDTKVLLPVMEELPSFFHGLSVTKIKKGRGGKVVALEFTWQAETKSDRRKKIFQKTSRQETLPDWADAETPPKPTLISLEDYSKLAEQMTRLGQSIEPYNLIEERYQSELKDWLKKWAKA